MAKSRHEQFRDMLRYNKWQATQHDVLAQSRLQRNGVSQNGLSEPIFEATIVQPEPVEITDEDRQQADAAIKNKSVWIEQWDNGSVHLYFQKSRPDAPPRYEQFNPDTGAFVTGGEVGMPAGMLAVFR
jgi:hypothetical protein